MRVPARALAWHKGAADDAPRGGKDDAPKREPVAGIAIVRVVSVKGTLAVTRGPSGSVSEEATTVVAPAFGSVRSSRP